MKIVGILKEDIVGILKDASAPIPQMPAILTAPPPPIPQMPAIWTVPPPIEEGEFIQRIGSLLPQELIKHPLLFVKITLHPMSSPALIINEDGRSFIPAIRADGTYYRRNLFSNLVMADINGVRTLVNIRG